MSLLKSITKAFVNPFNLSNKDLMGTAGALGAGALALGTGGTALPFLGAIGGSALSAMSANQNQKKQIAWERERALNAHQWEVQDLVNAGLNPILSAGGQGATTGGISAPMPDYSGISNIGNALTASATAKNLHEQNANLVTERENMQANTALLQEQTATQRAKTITEFKNQGLIDSNTAKAMAEANLNTAQMHRITLLVQQEQERLQAQIDEHKANAENLKAQKKINEAKAEEAKAEAEIRKKDDKTYWARFIGTAIKGVADTGVSAINAGANVIKAVTSRY